MRFAKNALLVALIIFTLAFLVSAQTLRSENDPRNTAPTVGTGGPVGGPTGLFTVYDGQTLRRGEYTFGIAYSNFDRDPGNADFSEIPVNFQIGVSDHLEFFFNTDAFRGIKVNSPANLSGFYLPNSQLRVGTGLVSPAAIVLAPQGPGTSQYPNQAIFRPLGNQVFAQYPFVGANAGTFGFNQPFTAGSVFGFPTAIATLGPPRAGSGNGADLFPGIGSPYGGILPGVVLQTVCTSGAATCSSLATSPTVFSVAPSYLPDAPFLNRVYGQSAFSTYTAGGKWRWTGPDNPVGVGVIAYYRWFNDSAKEVAGFNQLQRGASPGGNRGDIGVVLFGDARLRKWVNISGNVGMNYNSDVKGTFPSGTFTLLDRPNELLWGVGADFPVNKHFQPILEARAVHYVGGRTPNAFENNPIDIIGGARIFATRWMGFGAAYRYNWNQQDRDSFEGLASNSVTVAGRATTIVGPLTAGGVPLGFLTSSDPHGFIVNGWIGRRNARGAKPIENKPANVTNLELENSDNVVNLPCPPGYRSPSGKCNDDTMVGVRTSANDPEGDVLTYNYTVSGGRVVGSGANVNWDLSGVQPGTYTITAGVDDGCGVCGQTQTKTINVQQCDDCEKICSCPTISVSGPSESSLPGATMTFTANASNGDGITYNWTVSSGTIVEGQGTPVIRVATGDACPVDVTATVEIGGSDLCADCAKTASASAPVICPPQPRMIDQYNKLTNDDVKARVDAFWTALQNEPGSQGYVVLYGSAKEMAKSEAQVRGAITFRGYDMSRFTFVQGGGAPMRTAYWLVPTGATPPTP